MIALRLGVPIACWRKAHARELVETELLPPPATCYGALLSLVGEIDRARHIGCRVTAGMLNQPAVSTVLRSLWRIKSRDTPQGNGENARPDFQQLVINADLVVWCDSLEEPTAGERLEARVAAAIRQPSGVERFGGWSLGESTHLVNDASLLPSCDPPATCRTFIEAPDGEVTLPVWVDHVGTIATRYAVGTLDVLNRAPERGRIPQILPPDVRGSGRARGKG